MEKREIATPASLAAWLRYSLWLGIFDFFRLAWKVLLMGLFVGGLFQGRFRIRAQTIIYIGGTRQCEYEGGILFKFGQGAPETGWIGKVSQH